MSPARRIDRVTFAGSRDGTTVVIPWDSWQLLLERLEAEGDAEDVVAAIRGPGTSRPVTLTRAQKRYLLRVLTDWRYKVNVAGLPEGIVGGLPEGIVELWDALMYEAGWGDLDPDG
jgi:hypothetical protein